MGEEEREGRRGDRIGREKEWEENEREKEGEGKEE